VSQRYLADPAPLVYKGSVYFCCSDDDESPFQGGYMIADMVCVSSSDMKNWTDRARFCGLTKAPPEKKR
jgi:arabinoxylan arabinofuranohydrolase